MPADTSTPNYGWIQPAVGGDATVWGTKLNQTIAAIDSQVFSNEQGVLPVGSGALWFTNTPPANWLLCQGQTLAQASYQALYNAIGGTFNVGTVASGYFMLPSFSGRFPAGVGAPTTLGSTGGADSVVLTTANLPSHAHPIVDVAHNHGASQPAHIHPDPGHIHGVTDPQHYHQGSYNNSGPTAFPGVPPGSGELMQPGPTNYAPTGISINAAATGLQAAQPIITVNPSGTGLSTTQPVGSGAAVPTIPLYLQINFIIRFQ